MEQVAAVEECFSVGAEEMVAHSEEVVTSTEPVVSTPPAAPLTPPAVTNYIPIVAGTPVMQVVTLQTVQQSSPQVGLTNALRNIRLIAIQPRPVLNGAKPISLQPKSDANIQPQVVEAGEAKKVAVNNFYSKIKSSPVVLAPKKPLQQVAPKPSPKPIVKKPPPHIKPSPSYYKEQQREREMKEFSHLNEELSRGVRILLDLTTSLHHGTTWPFMERVDPVKDGAPDYEQVIETPMWLSKIKDKFRKNEYKSIKEFAVDMRLIFENCYRYNGPNHPVTKKALRLEQSFEQKLAALPANLKEACALDETDEERSARPTSSEAFFSVLHHRFRDEREKREQAAREKKEEELRKRREEKERQRALWAERMMNAEVKNQMKNMWEIPQLGHFLHLARGALHIGEIAQYELEHMFLMPEASVLLATLMTSLLSSPNQRAKLAESPPTPYSTWSTRLNGRVAEWYRTYNRELRNFVKVHELLGIEPMFWRVCGDTNPLDGGKKYHELSFLKRVWIFKGLCDSVSHSHKTVQEAMAEEEGPESRQVNLGTDSDGYTYLHFPAVSGSDIRVYRQKPWDVDIDPLWGPIVVQRKIEEEERAMEEERKAEELRRKKRAAAAAAKRTPAKKTPAKKKGARTPAQSTPTPQRKSERQQRLGTRVSPRTIQRQTGLAYKDTSSESEPEDEEDYEEVQKSDEDEASDSEQSVDKEPEVKEVAKKPAKRRRGGCWSSKRRRPVKKKLQKIDEEPETKEDEPEVEQVDVKAEEKTIVSGSEEQPEENGPVEIKKEVDEIKESIDESEQKETDQVNEGSNEAKQEVEVKEEITEVKKEVGETNDKEEDVKESPTQRFTVSQLIQKISQEEKVEEVPPPKTEDPTDEVAQKVEECDPDPDRPSYDPFFFELIISSVEQLQEWIDKFTDPPVNDDDDEEPRKRPRCEIKLRERLQALLDEAKPLAADQQQANEKICHQLWKEWERYRTSSSENGESKEGGVTNTQEFEMSDSEMIDEVMDESISDSEDEGVRKSRRLRTKRTRQQVNGTGSTRSSSPADEEPASKQARKGNYGYDPAWESDNSNELPGRRRSNFVPEMKNPEFWVGRRVTRATAAYVEPDFPESAEQQVEDSTQSAAGGTNDQTAISPAKTEQLIDQLRQLRRQQAMLSSNDPKPSDNSNAGSPNVFLPSKDGSLVRITNPKAAELLSRIKKPALASPRKIVIQIRSNGGNAAAVDISQLIQQAAEKGLIVPEEPRSFTIDIDPHGSFLVKAQMTPAGPKVLSAAPIRKNAVNIPAKDLPAETKDSIQQTETIKDPGTPKQILVNDPRQNNVISQELLQQVAGPEALGAKLTIVKEGNAKVLTLILANGEMRRLSTSQVQQIQAAVRNKAKPTPAAVSSSPTSTTS